MSVFSLLFLTAAIGLVAGRSTGPPAGEAANQDLVCQQMTPNPVAHGAPSAGSHNYRLLITPALNETATGFQYGPNQVYTIRIVGGNMRGFLVQARTNAPGVGVDPMLVGRFQFGASQKLLDCDLLSGVAFEATISHSTNLLDTMPAAFAWISPGTAGEVDFYYTIVRTRMDHFDAINARDFGLAPIPTSPPATDPPATDPPATDPPATDPPATDPPGTDPPPTQMPSVAAPTRTPERYRLRLQNPEGCSRPQCDVFIGIATNNDNDEYLDIYIEGKAEGWVAVGFTDSASMFSADVVACQRVGDDIFAHDAWNPEVRANTIDSNQDVILHSGTYSNGTLTCSISKKIMATDSQDLNLNEDLFIIWARLINAESSSASLDTHAFTPIGMDARGVSEARFNPSTAISIIGGSVFDTVHRPRLIRAHGILMIIAWGLFGLFGIFFANYFKTALPNGEWFQVHRAFMLATMFIGVAAFVLIFVALMSSGGLVDTTSRTSIVHMVFGIVVTFIMILNPILAIFRCKPDGKYRWIYNVLHGWLLGLIAEILALTNIALGLSIFVSTVSSTFSFSGGITRGVPLWTEVAWDVFYFIFSIGMAVAFPIAKMFVKDDSDCGKCKNSKKTINGEKFELKEAGEKSEGEQDTKERKKPSKLSPISWVGLVILLVVTVPVQLAVIVMVAFP